MVSNCHYRVHRRGRNLLRYAAGILAVLLAGQPAAPAADDYLQAIQAEVKDLDDANTTKIPNFGYPPPYQQPPAPPAPPPRPSPPVAPIQPAAGVPSRQQFELSLRSVYPGSFFLLHKLSEEEQQAVQREYQQTGDLARVRQLIMDLARH